MGYYCLFFGAAVSSLSVWVFYKSVSSLIWGIRRPGVIIGVDEQLRRGDSQRKKVYYHPVIEFETEEGNPFQFTFGSGSTQRRPTIGEDVSVVYKPGQPDKATLNSFMGMWAGPLAGAVLGGGFLYAGVQIVFFDA